MTHFQVQNMVSQAAMKALNNGEYVTIVFYVRVPRGTDYIAGQTFNKCNLQCEHNSI